MSEALSAFFLVPSAPICRHIAAFSHVRSGGLRVEDLLSDSVITGNAARDGEAFRGWFVGHFVPASLGLRSTRDLEVKWGMHTLGQTRAAGFGANDMATSLSVLISGCIHLYFEDGQEARLEQPGDYALWAPGVQHRWEIEQDNTVVLTVRWPSHG